MTRTPETNRSAEAGCLYMAMELSGKVWKLGFSDGACRRARRRQIPAGAMALLVSEVAGAKQKLKLGSDAPVRSVYEAGRDGFWLHHALEQRGYDNVVIDPASLEVDRKMRRAKTDRLDLEKLLLSLVRHHRGEKVWRLVRVPSEADEDARRPHRERDRLKKEIGALTSRMQGLLATQGAELKSMRYVSKQLQSLQRWNGSPLPALLQAELLRLSERRDVARKQLREVEADIEARVGQAQSTATHQAAMIRMLRGVSGSTGLVLASELFAWRQIRNRRQLGALVGLVGAPYDSGSSEREQGITKAGNARVRKLMVQLAWMWVRHQRGSAISRWFEERFGRGGKRSRRVGIVAVARRLLIALWRFVTDGVVPDGAELMPMRQAG